MPAAIIAIECGGGSGGEGFPEDALTVKGSCPYRFYYEGWNWFLEEYGNKITTKDITNMAYMFAENQALTKIPFDINCLMTANCSLSHMFYNCRKLTELPKITVKPSDLDYMFDYCQDLREIPEDFADTFDWSYIDNNTSSSAGAMSYRFYYCTSLRKIPFNFLKHVNPKISYGKSPFYYGFQNCYVLDELKLPAKFTTTGWTSSAFTSCFNNCNRIKELIFDTQEDGTPYSVNWKSQIINLAEYLGYANKNYYKNYILGFNSGITEDKLVHSATTYEALKNDPDWFAVDEAYSRYNHDSAVNTINSLPDTSAYLASRGGTNTIKFRTNAGANTDGGAISTLTEEEIAVAAAKGWTVSLV